MNASQASYQKQKTAYLRGLFVAETGYVPKRYLINSVHRFISAGRGSCPRRALLSTPLMARWRRQARPCWRSSICHCSGAHNPFLSATPNTKAFGVLPAIPSGAPRVEVMNQLPVRNSWSKRHRKDVYSMKFASERYRVDIVSTTHLLVRDVFSFTNIRCITLLARMFYS